MVVVNVLAWASALQVVTVPGGRLATTLANCYYHNSFLHLHFSASSPSQPILIEWLLWKTYLIKVDRSAKNWKTNPIPDPIRHFVAPWRPFWIIEVLIEGMIKSKTNLAKVVGGQQLRVWPCLQLWIKEAVRCWRQWASAPFVTMLIFVFFLLCVVGQ